MQKKWKEHRITDHTRRWIFNKTIDMAKKMQEPYDDMEWFMKELWDMLGAITLPSEAPNYPVDKRFTGLGISSLSNLDEGEPCDHPGCLSHVTHPCEGCGRLQGKGQII